MNEFKSGQQVCGLGQKMGRQECILITSSSSSSWKLGLSKFRLEEAGASAEGKTRSEEAIYTVGFGAMLRIGIQVVAELREALGPGKREAGHPDTWLIKTVSSS